MTLERTPRFVDLSHVIFTSRAHGTTHDDAYEVSLEGPLYNTKTSTLYPNAQITITKHEGRSFNPINMTFFNLYRAIWTGASSDEWDSIKHWNNTIWLKKSSLQEKIDISPKAYLSKSPNVSYLSEKLDQATSDTDDLGDIHTLAEMISQLTESLRNRGGIIIPSFSLMPSSANQQAPRLIRYRQVPKEVIFDSKFQSALLLSHARLQKMLDSFHTELNDEAYRELLNQIEEHVDFLNEQFIALNTYAAEVGLYTFFIPPLSHSKNYSQVLKTIDQGLRQIRNSRAVRPINTTIDSSSESSTKTLGILEIILKASGLSALRATEFANKAIEEHLQKIRDARIEEITNEISPTQIVNLKEIREERRALIVEIDALCHSINTSAQELRGRMIPRNVRSNLYLSIAPFFEGVGGQGMLPNTRNSSIYLFPVLARAHIKDVGDDVWGVIGSLYNRFDGFFQEDPCLRMLSKHISKESFDNFRGGNPLAYANDLLMRLHAFQNMSEVWENKQLVDDIKYIGHFDLDKILGIPFINWNASLFGSFIEMFHPQIKTLNLSTMHRDHTAIKTRYNCLETLFSLYRNIPSVIISNSPEACIALSRASQLDGSRKDPLKISQLTIENCGVDDTFLQNLDVSNLEKLRVTQSLITGNFLSSNQYSSLKYLDLSNNPLICSSEESSKSFTRSLSTLLNLKNLELDNNRINLSLLTSLVLPKLKVIKLHNTSLSIEAVREYDEHILTVFGNLLILKGKIEHAELDGNEQRAIEIVKRSLEKISSIGSKVNPHENNLTITKIAIFIQDLSKLIQEKRSIERIKEELPELENIITTLQQLQIGTRFAVYSHSKNAEDKPRLSLPLFQSADSFENNRNISLTSAQAQGVRFRTVLLILEEQNENTTQQ